ncbi:hypothetical protein BGZ63DRAFT_203483 [Mariannaea sp. PMI_226]|nr:hypothetical protein BGZ63DRAFT_203483 [Mariannaea sp. PMI_226]
MEFALLCQAEIQGERMREDIYENGSAWVLKNESQLDFLPGPMTQRLTTNTSMREGFVNMCSHIAGCLKQKQLPNEANVLSIHQFKTREWPPVTKTYLRGGGTVAAVANILFERAMNQDVWSGDGSHQRDFGGEIKELPQCRNDHEYGFVSGMCGYQRVSPVCYVDAPGQAIDLNNFAMTMLERV